ncbi:hypothetical protein CEP52_006784 [Fusarium oligoseptatum]|uniref:DAD domain-containing protein n=1 Tax=Fusarium oligoseptatum TaxID=2604345 RepID=A0A428TQY3_9HYPO|nr:hypothetical protein CEP52_006784 [Fusarium oligoseptatum]
MGSKRNPRTETSYDAQREAYASMRHPGTLNWLLESSEYQTWTQRQPQTLHWYGVSGAGKSVAAAAVVQDLEARFGKGENTGIVYIFFDLLRSKEQSYDNLITCLIQQLLRTAPSWETQEYFSETNAGSYPVPRLLRNCFERRSTVFVVLDAMDECHNSAGVELLGQLFRLQRSHGNMNVLVTSRAKSVPSMPDGPWNIKALEIRASEDDIRQYVASALDIPSKEEGQQGSMVSKVVHAACGRFLRAKLYLDLYALSSSLETLDTALLNALPADPDNDDDIYDRILEQLDSGPPQRANTVHRALPWLVVSYPLSILELQQVLQLSTDGSDGLNIKGNDVTSTIIPSFGGLVRIEDINGCPYVRLFHRAANDYLSRRLHPERGTVGARCIAYLSNASESGPCQKGMDLVQRLKLNPLYQYATHTWGQHVRSITTPLSTKAIRDFLDDPKKWRSALQATEEYMGHSVQFLERLTTMHYAAREAANIFVSLLLQDGSSDMANAEDGSGRTPLSYAVKSGSMDIVDMLLTDARVKVDVRDNEGCTPLMVAAKHGHTAVVSKLLRHRANPNLQDLKKTTPIWYAAERGYGGVVRALLESGWRLEMNPIHDMKSHERLTPLAVAMVNGHRECASMLVQANGFNSDDDGISDDIDLAVQYRYDDIALVLLDQVGIRQHKDSELLVSAVRVGSVKVVKRLLDKHDVDPNAVCSSQKRYESISETPLMAAASRQNKEVVRLLLNAGGIQPDFAVDHGETALSRVAKEGLADMVKMLVADNRVDVNHQDDKGRTALSLAVEAAHETVVAELLAVDTIDPDRQDSDGRTPLAWVRGSEWPYSSEDRTEERRRVAEMLLASGRVDPNTKDHSGRSPIVYAIERKNNDVAKAILKHPKTNTDYHSLLLTSIAWDNEDMGRMLLGTGRIDVNASVLSLAARRGNERMVDILLAFPDTNVDQKNGDGRTPLAEAADEGHQEIVEKLLAKGANPNTWDSDGMTPLCLAVVNPWRPDMVSALLRAHNINPDLADHQGRTPLSWAAEKEAIEAVDLLLATGAVNPDVADLQGRTPLSWAAESGNATVIDLLLQIPTVDPNTQDKWGLTPLIYAIQRGRDIPEDQGTSRGGVVDCVKLLLEQNDLNLNKRSQEGKTPIAIARQCGEMETVAILREYGAEDTAVSKDPDLSELEDNTLQTRSRQVDVEKSLQRSNAFRWTEHAYTHPIERVPVHLDRQEKYINLMGNSSNDNVELCRACAAMNLTDVFSNPHHHEDTISELGKVDQTWEKRDCPMCRLIAVVRPRHDINGHQENDDEPWYYFRPRWFDTVVLGVVADPPPRDVTESVFASGVIGRLGSNCPEGEHAITIPRLSGEIDFATARAWIECCKTNHAEPCNLELLDPIPNLYLIDCNTRKIVKQEVTGQPPYVALSYVWGNLSSLGKATRKAEHIAEESNWEPHERSVDANGPVDLVIQDAIWMTQELGYRYLWVDQYCVIQKGNDAIKQEQLRHMHTVYTNAEVTLVACAGDNASFGLAGAPGRARSPQQAAKIQGHVLTCIPPDPAYVIRKSTWATRGWTYQECILARRCLFFSEHEMSYECRGLLCREALRLPLRIERAMHTLERPVDSLWMVDTDRTVSVDEGDCGFSKLLDNYTTRTLSCRSDTLNAMLGILEMLGQARDWPLYHVCGVPVLHGDTEGMDSDINPGGLTAGLCWDLTQPAIREASFPSWSWAGWQGAATSMFMKRAVHNLSYIDVSVVVDDETAKAVPWHAFYRELQRKEGQQREEQQAWRHGQNHVLKIEVEVVMVRFLYTGKLDRRSGITKLSGFVSTGNSVWKGKFSLTREDVQSQLFKTSWLGAIIGSSYHRTYILVVRKQKQASPYRTGTYWERVGLLGIRHFEVVAAISIMQVGFGLDES